MKNFHLFYTLLISFFINSIYAIGPTLSPDEYLNSAQLIGVRVDQSQNLNELLKIREIINNDQADLCFEDRLPHDTFSEQISYFVQKMLDDTNARVGVVGSYYGTSSDDSKYSPVSLIHHPLCHVTNSSLSKTIGSKIPDNQTIGKINKFVDLVNTLRTETINGSEKSKKELLNTWTNFYSCLAYTESLSGPDTKSSKAVASKYSPPNYRRPSGVQFYEDPSQSKESKLNIGMYQFTPSASNNIQSCLQAWNDLHKNNSKCMISTKSDQVEMIKTTGSSLQSFNAFCGIHKMIQTFSIQVNTTKTSATHPENILNGKLKASNERCVSPHFKAGLAYVHFGPFMNSTGSNLSELFSCVDKNL